MISEDNQFESLQDTRYDNWGLLRWPSCSPVEHGDSVLKYSATFPSETFICLSSLIILPFQSTPIRNATGTAVLRHNYWRRLKHAGMLLYGAEAVLCILLLQNYYRNSVVLHRSAESWVRPPGAVGDLFVYASPYVVLLKYSLSKSHTRNVTMFRLS